MRIQPKMVKEQMDNAPQMVDLPPRTNCSNNEFIRDYDRVATAARPEWLRRFGFRACGNKDAEYCIMRRHHMTPEAFWSCLTRGGDEDNPNAVLFNVVKWGDFLALFPEIEQLCYEKYLSLEHNESGKLVFDVEAHTFDKTCYSFPLFRAIADNITDVTEIWFAKGHYTYSFGKEVEVIDPKVLFMVRHGNRGFNFFNLSQDPAFF